MIQPNTQVAPVAHRLLIAEDDKNLADAIQKLIHTKYKSVEVHFAYDGLEALALANAIKPDLILLDIVMPHCDGAEVFRILRSMDSTSNIPVALMTGYKNTRKTNDLIEQSGLDCLFKPFSGNELIAFLTQQMDLQCTLTG